MARSKKQIESDIKSALAIRESPAASTDLYADRRVRRVSRDMKQTMARLDQALSHVQGLIGSNITVVGMAERDRVSYDIGDDAFSAIEKIRRRISRAL